MNKNDIINRIKSNISLYEHFICPDFPDLGIYSNQYKDILVKLFDNANSIYSIIYCDVNKLSVVNERYGKEIGDKTLYTLLRLFTKSKFMPDDALTLRIGGDEFITFIPNKDKIQVEKIIKCIQDSIKQHKDILYGSSIAFGVEDSRSGKYDSIITIAEHKVEQQKLKNRQGNINSINTGNSKHFVSLPIPDDLTEEQQEKWRALNTKINVAIDNHLRDIRPSNPKFEYDITTIKLDAKTFIYAFANLLNNRIHRVYVDNSILIKQLDIPYNDALRIHSLFQHKDIDLCSLSENDLKSLSTSLTVFCESLVRNKHSKLLAKSYYKIFLADELAKSKQKYQFVYYSMSGIRPRNTAYGHSTSDIGLKKTYEIATYECTSRREINNTPFSFNKNDSFLIDQDGGNFIHIIPMDNRIDEKEVEDITASINSHYEQTPDSTFKVASVIKNNVNRRSIPFYINSPIGEKQHPIEFIRTLYQIIKKYFNKLRIHEPSSTPKYLTIDKPFVQFARYLKQTCNYNKDSIKVESLSESTNQDSIEEVFEECISFYLSEIYDAKSISTQKFLLDNVLLSLVNHEVYNNTLNRRIYERKMNSRKILMNLFGLNNSEELEKG